MVLDTKELRIAAVRVVHRAMGIGAYTFAALTGAQYPKLLGLRAAAERALVRGDLDEAERRARELLELAERYRTDWYYGNAFHHAHLVLGQAAAARHDLDAAHRHLLDAARTPGSPQLNSFGPNMHLAQTLLRAGVPDAVLEYFALCRNFWTNSSLDRWKADVRAGREPDFGPNLVY